MVRVSQSSRRPANALPSVTSSAYSRSEPTGSPLARRVTATSGARSRSSRGDVQRGRLAGRRRVRRQHDLADRRVGGGDARVAARRSSGPRGRRRRSATARRRARGSARGTRACAPSGSRRRAPRRRRSATASRRSSWQIEQRGSSARLKQTSHRPIRSLTSRIASASAGRVLGGGAQDVEREPLRCARADPGQLRQLGDQALDRRRVGGAHRPGRPRPPRPPSRGRRSRRPACARRAPGPCAAPR